MSWSRTAGFVRERRLPSTASALQLQDDRGRLTPTAHVKDADVSKSVKKKKETREMVNKADPPPTKKTVSFLCSVTNLYF